MERQSTSKLFRIALAVVAFFVLCTSAVLFSSCNKEEAHQHVYSYIDAVATPTGSDDESPSVTYTCEICGDQITVPIAPSSVTMQRIQDVLTQHSSNLEGVLTKLNAGRLADLQNVLQSEIRNLDDATSAKLNAAIENFSASVREYNSSVESAHNDIANAIENQTSNVQHLNDVLSQVYSFIYGVAPTAEDPSGEITTEPTLEGNSLNNYLSFLSNYVKYLKYLVAQDSEALSALANDVSSIKDAVISTEDETKTVISEVGKIATAISGIAGSIGTPTEGKTIFELLEKIAKALPESGSSSHSHALVLVPDVIGDANPCTTPLSYHYECLVDGCDLDLSTQDHIVLPPKGHTIVWVDLEELKTATPTGSDGNYGPNDKSEKHGYPLQGITEHYHNATCIAPAQVEGYCTSCKQWTGIWSSVGSPTYQHNYVLENPGHQVEGANGCKHVGTNVYHCTTCGGAYVEEVTIEGVTPEGKTSPHNYYTIPIGENDKREGETVTQESLWAAWAAEHDTTVNAMTPQQKNEVIASYLNIVFQAAPTCTEPGIVTIECRDCGVRYAYSYNVPLGHMWKVDALATDDDSVCLSPVFSGTILHCTVCGYYHSATEDELAGQKDALAVGDVLEQKKSTALDYTTDYLKSESVTYNNLTNAGDLVTADFKRGEEKSITAYTEAVIKATANGYVPHKFDTTSDKYKVSVVEGDCDTPAVYYYVCTKCGVSAEDKEFGKVMDESGDKDFVDLHKDGDDYKAWVLGGKSDATLAEIKAKVKTAKAFKEGDDNATYTAKVQDFIDSADNKEALKAFYGKATAEAKEDTLLLVNVAAAYFGWNITCFTIEDEPSHQWVIGEDRVFCMPDPVLTDLYKDWVKGTEITVAGWIKVTSGSEGAPDTYDWVEGKTYDKTLYPAATYYKAVKFFEDHKADTKKEFVYSKLSSSLDETFLANATKYGITDFCTRDNCPLHTAPTEETEEPFTASFYAAREHVYEIYKYNVAGKTGSGMSTYKDLTEGDNAFLQGVELTLPAGKTENDLAVFEFEPKGDHWEKGDDADPFDLYFLQYLYECNTLKTLTLDTKYSDYSKASGLHAITGDSFTCYFVERCVNFDSCGRTNRNAAHVPPSKTNPADAQWLANCQHTDLCTVCHQFSYGKIGDHRLYTYESLVANEAYKEMIEYLIENAKDDTAWAVVREAFCYSETAGQTVRVCAGCLEAWYNIQTKGASKATWSEGAWVEITDPSTLEEVKSGEITVNWLAKTTKNHGELTSGQYGNYYVDKNALPLHTFTVTSSNLNDIVKYMQAHNDLGEKNAQGADWTLDDIKAKIIEIVGHTDDPSDDVVETLAFSKDGALRVDYVRNTAGEYSTECNQEKWSEDYCLICSLNEHALKTVRNTKGDHPTDTVKTLEETDETGKYAYQGAFGHVWAPVLHYNDTKLYTYEVKGGEIYLQVVCIRCQSQSQPVPAKGNGSVSYYEGIGEWYALENVVKAEMGDSHTAADLLAWATAKDATIKGEDGKLYKTEDAKKRGIEAGQEVQALEAVDGNVEKLESADEFGTTLSGMKDGGVLYLEEGEVTLSGSESFAAGKDYVIELGEKASMKSTDANVEVSGGANVTVKGGSFDLTTKHTDPSPDNTRPAFVVEDGSSLTLEGVTIVNQTDGSAVLVLGGNAIINNCRIFSYGEGYQNCGVMVSKGSLSISDSTVAVFAHKYGEEFAQEKVNSTMFNALAVFGGKVEATNCTFISPAVAAMIYARKHGPASGVIEATLKGCTYTVGIVKDPTAKNLEVDLTKHGDVESMEVNVGCLLLQAGAPEEATDESVKVTVEGSTFSAEAAVIGDGTSGVIGAINHAGCTLEIKTDLADTMFAVVSESVKINDKTVAKNVG